jgi:hypothetical protein
LCRSSDSVSAHSVPQTPSARFPPYLPLHMWYVCAKTSVSQCLLNACLKQGENQREGRSPSYFNIDEATLVKHYIRALLDEGSYGLSE